MFALNCQLYNKFNDTFLKKGDMSRIQPVQSTNSDRLRVDY